MWVRGISQLLTQHNATTFSSILCCVFKHAWSNTLLDILTIFFWRLNTLTWLQQQQTTLCKKLFKKVNIFLYTLFKFHFFKDTEYRYYQDVADLWSWRRWYHDIFYSINATNHHLTKHHHFVMILIRGKSGASFKQETMIQSGEVSLTSKACILYGEKIWTRVNKLILDKLLTQ